MGKPNQTDNREWVRSAVDRYQGQLCRYAARILGEEERARDVVQDTFVRLCSQEPAAVDGHLAEWLFTVCRNRALDVRRKEQRMTTMSEIPATGRASPAPSPSVAAERVEATGRAVALLASLPPRQREVIRLKFQGGLSYRAIGCVMGLSVSNVGFLIHTGLKTLRQKLKAT